MAAHFFVFWFGALSNITPLVTLAAYTAAGIAEADPMKTSIDAFKLALPCFIVPFMIVYNPVLIMQPAAGTENVWLVVIFAVVTAIIAIFALAISIANFFRVKLIIIERIGFFASAIMLIKPGLLTDGIGIALLVVLLAIHITKSNQNAGTKNTVSI